eukprot:4671493-Lingulodinium_polyedra.AAC.1
MSEGVSPDANVAANDEFYAKVLHHFTFFVTHGELKGQAALNTKFDAVQNSVEKNASDHSYKDLDIFHKHGWMLSPDQHKKLAELMTAIGNATAKSGDDQAVLARKRAAKGSMPSSGSGEDASRASRAKMLKYF